MVNVQNSNKRKKEKKYISKSFVAGFLQIHLENKKLLYVLRGMCVTNKDGPAEENMLARTNYSFKECYILLSLFSIGALLLLLSSL